MKHSDIIDKTVTFVRDRLDRAEGGHDWWHIFRVWQHAKLIASQEPANLLIVELGALLHDIADAKFHHGDESKGGKITAEFLQKQGVSSSVIDAVLYIVENISYRKSFQTEIQKTTELCIVQDADRLDAMGAIGIARAFSYGGHKNRPIHDPTLEPLMNNSYDHYTKSNAPTLHHFYEKLLLLKDKMNTEMGRKLASDRHEFMRLYLDQFFQEWPKEK